MSAAVLSVVDQLPQVVSNREAIEALELFLVEARAGRIVAVAIAAVTNARQAQTIASTCDDQVLLLGALSRLSFRINESIGTNEAQTGGAA
jgi:hypothetical protein